MPSTPTDEFWDEWPARAVASEQLFFASMPVAHVVAHETHLRATRLAQAAETFRRTLRRDRW
jgi:hypothetical protein